MSSEMTAELLKNAPVLLRRYFPFWQLLHIDSGFKRCVSMALGNVDKIFHFCISYIA